MKNNANKLMGRRGFFGSAAGVLGAGLWSGIDLEAYPQNTQTNSKPSALRITDLRIANVPRRAIVRIDTNQGISGYGEVRDGAPANYALMLKRVVMGQNPCNVPAIFRRIKQFGNHGRQGGGVAAVETACWDLAGKAYNVPIFQMLGGQYRDKVRIYADTPQSDDPQVFGERLKRRVEEGFTFLKMDCGIGMIRNVEGALTYPDGYSFAYNDPIPHMFTNCEITEKGVQLMADYLLHVREVVGWKVPIATDHYGHVGVNSIIRLGKALEKCNLAWLEDTVPWQNTELLKQITQTLDINILTGEDIFGIEPFEVLCREHAVDMIHPDPGSCGGIFETHAVGNMAQAYGVPMAIHMAGSPIAAYAAVHIAAASENFVACENHDIDNARWGDLVDGVPKPIINKGFIPVPEGPGLGVQINEEALKALVRDGNVFNPTPEWDAPRGGYDDRPWS